MKYISTASRVALGYSGGAAAATSEGSPPQPRSPRRRRRRPSDGGRRRRGISASFYFLPPGVLLIFHPTKIQVVPDRDSPRSIWWWLSFVAGLSIWLPLSCVASLTIWPSPCLLCHPPDLLGDRPSDLGVIERHGFTSFGMARNLVDPCTCTRVAGCAYGRWDSRASL
jgi:hypothetical protein